MSKPDGLVISAIIAAVSSIVLLALMLRATDPGLRTNLLATLWGSVALLLGILVAIAYQRWRS